MPFVYLFVCFIMFASYEWMSKKHIHSAIYLFIANNTLANYDRMSKMFVCFFHLGIMVTNRKHTSNRTFVFFCLFVFIHYYYYYELFYIFKK